MEVAKVIGCGASQHNGLAWPRLIHATGGQISRIVEVQLVKGNRGQEWPVECIDGFGTINSSSASAAGPGRAGTRGGAATFGLSGRGELLPVGLLLELIGMLRVMSALIDGGKMR